MQSLGGINVTPLDQDIQIGFITLPAGSDVLYVRMAQTSGIGPWHFSFGLLSWRTTNGRELGTVKAFPHYEGETYRLGVGLSPVERTGSLWFTPRSYNIGWIKSGQRLSLDFAWEAGVLTPAGLGSIASFVNQAGVGLNLVRVAFP
jgi:hypothetical protein